MKRDSFQPNSNFLYYLYWMCERMDIFWQKYEGKPAPWTADPILQEKKFCNVYRCLDRVSQYLLRNVIYNGREYAPEDMFFRILLFKHFNRCETWDALVKEFGDITYNTGFENIARFLDDLIQKETIYGNAYMITGWFYQLPEYSYLEGMAKHRAYFSIFEREIFDTGRIYDFLEAPTLEALYNEFLKLKPFGDFVSQQYAIDMNYSPLFDFDENSFVITGPGSIRGIQRTFEGANKRNFVDIIKWVQTNLPELLADFAKDTGMEFRPLPNRMPALIDCQSGFCETDKYLRAADIQTEGVKVKGKRMKADYVPSTKRIEYVFPEKWGVELCHPQQ